MSQVFATASASISLIPASGSAIGALNPHRKLNVSSFSLSFQTGVGHQRQDDGRAPSSVVSVVKRLYREDAELVLPVSPEDVPKVRSFLTRQ